VINEATRLRFIAREREEPNAGPAISEDSIPDTINGLERYIAEISRRVAEIHSDLRRCEGKGDAEWRRRANRSKVHKENQLRIAKNKLKDLNREYISYDSALLESKDTAGRLYAIIRREVNLEFLPAEDLAFLGVVKDFLTNRIKDTPESTLAAARQETSK
jgi:predicted secreted protein